MKQTVTFTQNEAIEKYGKEVAEKLFNFYQEAKKGIVEFSFTKVNGEIRQAKGTLNPDLVEGLSDSERKYLKEVFPTEDVPEGEISLFDYRSIVGKQHYYDVEKGGIRQFDPNKLVLKNKEFYI